MLLKILAISLLTLCSCTFSSVSQAVFAHPLIVGSAVTAISLNSPETPRRSQGSIERIFARSIVNDDVLNSTLSIALNTSGVPNGVSMSMRARSETRLDILSPIAATAATYTFGEPLMFNLSGSRSDAPPDTNGRDVTVFDPMRDDSIMVDFNLRSYQTYPI